MTVYVIADVKVTDDRWVPAYAASVHDIVPVSYTHLTLPTTPYV